jgi:peptidoglycan/xylan/chitin deacetylase (PgdA/CDA1 family)
VATGLYHSGVLRILQAISRHYEIAPGNSRRIQFLRRTTRAKFAVLCYHRVGTGGIPLFSELPAKIFEEQMQFLRRRYRVISLDELCEEMERPTRNGDAVAVTFDDGYRDLFTYALPVLRNYQIPATIFLPAISIETGEVPWYDRIFLMVRVFPKDDLEITLDRPRIFRLASRTARLQAATEIIQYLRTLPDWRRREHCQDLEKQVILPSEVLRDRMLTWDQIRAMCRAGISFGSHTMTHPVVSQLTEAQLESELAESKRLLEQRIASPIRHFAFPFGQPADCGKAALPVLARLGYRSAATTVEGTNAAGEKLYALRRTQIGNERSVPLYAFKLNQLFLSAGVHDSATHSPASLPFAGEAFHKCETKTD